MTMESHNAGVQDREACGDHTAGVRTNRHCIIRWIAGFIRSTACKDRIIVVNKTINWKLESTVRDVW